MEIIQTTIFGVNPDLAKKKRGPKFTVQLFSDGRKQCTKCREIKPIDAFARAKSFYDGKFPRCRQCVCATGWKYRHRSRVTSWDRHYRISEQVYWDLFEEQGEVCAICKQPETWICKGTLALLSVDHDHKTGMVRGLLCRHCNHGLGRFFDRPELLDRASIYLQR